MNIVPQPVLKLQNFPEICLDSLMPVWRLDFFFSLTYARCLWEEVASWPFLEAPAEGAAGSGEGKATSDEYKSLLKDGGCNLGLTRV